MYARPQRNERYTVHKTSEEERCLRHRHVRRTTRSAPVPVGSRAPPTLFPSCLLCSYIIRLPTGNVTCAASTPKLSLCLCWASVVFPEVPAHVLIACGDKRKQSWSPSFPPPLHTHKRGVVLLWCAGLCRGEAGGTGGGRSRRECPRHRHVRRTTRSAPVPPALLPLCLFLDFYHTFACRKRDVQQYDSKFTTCSLTQNCHDCTRLVTLTLAASPISATFPPPHHLYAMCWCQALLIVQLTHTHSRQIL